MINRKLLAGAGASALALTLAACADDGGDSAANGAGDATITLATYRRGQTDCPPPILSSTFWKKLATRSSMIRNQKQPCSTPP